jgi:hypothetical protein
VDDGLAMHSLAVAAPGDFLQWSWDELADKLKTVGAGRGPGFLFSPGGRAIVRSTPQAMGRSLLSVTAPDQIGLLWAICAWLASHDVTIEAMRVANAGTMSHDEFIVQGMFDPDELAERLSAEVAPGWFGLAHEVASSVLSTIRSVASRAG